MNSTDFVAPFAPKKPVAPPRVLSADAPVCRLFDCEPCAGCENGLNPNVLCVRCVCMPEEPMPASAADWEMLWLHYLTSLRACLDALADYLRYNVVQNGSQTISAVDDDLLMRIFDSAQDAVHCCAKHLGEPGAARKGVLNRKFFGAFTRNWECMMSRASIYRTMYPDFGSDPAMLWRLRADASALRTLVARMV